MLKNKKADTSVTLLVLLTVALCVTCLFYFYISEKNRETEIITFGTLNDFYIQTDGTDYLIKNLAREIITSNPNMDNETFLNEFKKQFATTYWNMNPGVVRQIRTESYDVRIKDKILYFNMKNFTAVGSYERKNGGIYSITYQKDIAFIVSIK